MKIGKITGIGNTATVYEWEEGKVLKLFYQGYSSEAIENEFHNAMAIRNMKFAKPKGYEMISYEDRRGIIYDKLEGESLIDRVMKTGDLQECATYMANLHKEIVQNKISGVQNYKDFLKHHLLNAVMTMEKRNEVLQMIDKLPYGDALCHGDFHPGNILISSGNAFAIDFMNICQGPFLYDVARTIFLIEYAPVPTDAEDKDMILQFKKTLVDLYLEQMNVTREMIQEYLSVIIMVRKGECPNE